MNTQVMRPGILVALRTSVSGGVHYVRTDLDEAEDGTVTRWETTRHIDDPAEHKRARDAARLAARGIWKLCVQTNFGLLCPMDREDELDLAIAAARVTVDLWNTEARYTWISVNAIKGRIADNDEEAVRALLEEAKELVQQMDEGLGKADVVAIRNAAARAKRLVGILGEDAAGDVSELVKAARDAAKTIVKRVGAEGATVEEVVRTVNRDAFDKARFAFLDVVKAQEDALPPIDVQRMAEIEAFRQANIESSRRRGSGEGDTDGDDSEEVN